MIRSLVRSDVEVARLQLADARAQRPLDRAQPRVHRGRHQDLRAHLESEIGQVAAGVAPGVAHWVQVRVRV